MGARRGLGRICGGNAGGGTSCERLRPLRDYLAECGSAAGGPDRPQPGAGISLGGQPPSRDCASAPAGAMAAAAFCGVVRWGVLAQTVDVLALGLVQPLHGFTFALLHLAAMRIIGDTVPRDLAATAQAVYGLVAVGGATAVLILVSGWLYAHFGAAGFWGMAALCVAAFPVIWLLQRALSSSRPQSI